MITKNTLLFLCMGVLALAGCSSKNDDTNKSPTQKPTGPTNISYNLGLLMGNQAKIEYDEIDFTALQAGLSKAYRGEAQENDYTDAQHILHSYNHLQRTKKAQEALGKGEAYRAENAKRPGVTVSKSGLQYEIIQQGSGLNPTLEDTVTIHYRGTLVDGTEFDSSISRVTPVSFPLKNLIKGWQEGVTLMQAGAKYRFVIPPELGYGSNGVGRIPPNSTLIFDIELIKIGESGPAKVPAAQTPKS